MLIRAFTLLKSRLGPLPMQNFLLHLLQHQRLDLADATNNNGAVCRAISPWRRAIRRDSAGTGTVGAIPGLPRIA